VVSLPQAPHQKPACNSLPQYMLQAPPISLTMCLQSAIIGA
jgi:hypothetical protein